MQEFRQQLFGIPVRKFPASGAQSGQAYMWNPESFQVLLCNLESWPLESRIQLKEFGIKVRIGIQNPSSTDEESGFQYLES